MISLSRYEAVIFDMDGVLIDSEPLWKIAMEEVFQDVGCALTRADFQKTVGLRIDEVVRYWYRHVGWSGFTPTAVEEAIVTRMVSLINQQGSPLPGVLETLHFLSQNEIKIGLATSSYEVLIDAVLESIQARTYFDVTHSAQHEAFGKPHPAVYLTTAQRLGVEPQKCLVIEDSLNGIISAKAAGMHVVCIPEKTHHPEPKLIIADYRHESMPDLLTIMKKSIHDKV